MALDKNCPDIYIIILNYNRWEDTIECVESVINSEFRDFQIILLDNNSPNDSEERILEYLNGKRKSKITNLFFRNKLRDRKSPLPFIYHRTPNSLDSFKKMEKSVSDLIQYPIIFVQTNQNLGFAGGNNIGLNLLIKNNVPDSSKIFLLNPDTFLDIKSLQNISAIAEEEFISGCQIKDYNDPEKTLFYGGYQFFKPLGLIKPIIKRQDNNIDYIYGGALITNIKTIKKNGVLPLDYFLYWEETEWSYKAKLFNTKLLVCGEAVVYDKVGTSIGRGYLAHYYYSRNSLIFYKKYFKIYIPTLLLAHGLRALNKVRKNEFKAALAYFHGIKDFLNGKKGYTPIS